MPVKYKRCPHCGQKIKQYLHPVPTVDILIEMVGGGIILIKRKNPPYGWALPGGFVDYGESVETAARREAREETGLEVEALEQFRVYSEPARDPRHHTVSVAFTAAAVGTPKAADDAKRVGVFRAEALPDMLAFDHGEILRDYFRSQVATD